MRAIMTSPCDHKKDSQDRTRFADSRDCFHGSCLVIRRFTDGSFLLKNRYKFVRRANLHVVRPE